MHASCTIVVHFPVVYWAWFMAVRLPLLSDIQSSQTAGLLTCLKFIPLTFHLLVLRIALRGQSLHFFPHSYFWGESLLYLCNGRIRIYKNNYPTPLKREVLSITFRYMPHCYLKALLPVIVRDWDNNPASWFDSLNLKPRLFWEIVHPWNHVFIWALLKCTVLRSSFPFIPLFIQL